MFLWLLQSLPPLPSASTRCRVSLLFIVSQQEKTFSTVLLFIPSTFSCIRRHLCRKFPTFADNKIKTFNFFFSSFGVFSFYHRHVLATFNQIMCVYLCLLREDGKLLLAVIFVFFLTVHVSSHRSNKTDSTRLDSVQIVSLIMNAS